MNKTTALQAHSPGTESKQTEEAGRSDNYRRDFLVTATNMSWQLAIAVLVPIIGGVELGKAAGNAPVFTVIGLVLALVLSALVMWRAMQAANRLPVPKLTAAQKRAIRKSYEEDDN